MKKTILLTLLLAVVLGFSTANAQSIPPPSECPDLGPSYGSSFSGNVADPNNPYQYVAIWNGVTIGCVACPPGLVYNEEQNLCIYGGNEAKFKSAYPICGTEMRWVDDLSAPERVSYINNPGSNERTKSWRVHNGQKLYTIVKSKYKEVNKTRIVCEEGEGSCLIGSIFCKARSGHLE